MDGHFLKKNVVFVAVIVGVFLISGAFIFNLSKDSETSSAELSVNNTLERIVATTAVIDSDGDGLKDWEEILLGTDPQNPDTDGDGVLDGQESNGEGMAASDGIDQSKVDALPDTEKLAFKLFEGYIDLKKKNYLGTNIEESFVADLIESSLPIISYETYTENDLTAENQVIKDAKDHALTYRSTLNVAWTPLFSIKEDELIVFARIVESGYAYGFTQLVLAKSAYEETIGNMLRVPVPYDAVSIHLDILNSFSFFIGVLDTMINVNDDPLRALVAVDGYARGEEQIRASIERLRTYLLIKGITE